MSNVQEKSFAKLRKEIVDVVAAPERIIQFGTGVLLRGLVDYAINKANKQHFFNGSVVMIKSTNNGNGDEFAEQENLYTVAIRGMENGLLLQQYDLNSSISCSINANSNWNEVLQLAHNEQINIIISNTTEAGIVLNETDHYNKQPPVSFPGKLLAVLYERYKYFQGDISKGYIIVPTELISNNGEELKKIVLNLAAVNESSAGFVKWIEEANAFCNSLVDRIVTGKPSQAKLNAHWQHLEYKDELLIECEPYLLWAIEGGEKVKEQLSFCTVVNGVVVEPSIEKYKELKLRLLNGTHTFMCGMAFLKGFSFVRNAMEDKQQLQFMKDLMLKEICPTLGYDTETVTAYAQAVIERFRNPFIDHLWHSITLNYTQKMMFRNLETIQRYYENKKELPHKMALCFAWYLHFMTPVAKNENGQWYAVSNNKEYLINDPEAEKFYLMHQLHKEIDYVQAVLENNELWNGFNFNQLPGFADAVTMYYLQIVTS
jgi:tagaturonate reductase